MLAERMKEIGEKIERRKKLRSPKERKKSPRSERSLKGQEYEDGIHHSNEGP